MNRSYWTFLFKSQGRHNLHSPFVFDLVDKGLTAKIPETFKKSRKSWFQKLSKDNELFSVTDLGSGSGKLSDKRSVSQLSKNSSSRGIYGDLLYRISAHLKPKTMLELGTSIGVGTVHLKQGSPDSLMITVEGCPETFRRAYRTFDQWELKKTVGFNNSFSDFLETPSDIVYDLVFIDGHHDGKATLEYIASLEKNTHNETAFILDDIRWNDDMWRAWQTLVADEKFHVTIDFGRMGVIWKRPKQTKEHFVIRPKIFRFKLI